MSAETAHAVPGERLRVAPLTVGAGIRALFGILMAIGVVTFALEVSADPTRAFAAWLTNYWVFLGLGLAGTFFSAIHYLVGATWSVTVRRLADAFSAFVPWGLLLFIPVAIGIPHLYVWAGNTATQAEGANITKGGWLQPIPFIVINGLCLLLWSFFSWYFARNSTRQDETRDPKLSVRNLHVSAIFIVSFAITYTLVTFFDIMSLEPTWYSTIFGVYNWAGIWQSGLAAMTILAVLLRRQGALRGVVGEAHYWNLGKLLFAFAVFWTYIGFSQLMLIWYANLPEEIGWMIKRIYTGWGAILVVVTALKWFIPFFVLMPVKWKTNETVLVTIAAGIVLGQWLDVYWMVYPAFSPEHAVLSWNEIGVALGFLGFFGWRVQSFLSRHPVAPHGDPDFVASVRFHE